MVTDQEIALALETLVRDSSSTSSTTTTNPNNPNRFTSINGVVQELESKLGIDLSHKIDFIHHLLLLHQSQSQPHKDHFALQQPHNFPPNPPHFPPNFHGFPPVPKSDAAVAVAGQSSGGVEGPKESVKPRAKRRGGPGGLNKLCGVSPELQAIVGQPTMPRTEIVKQLWAYIRKNNLQDPNNKRKIVCNDELRLVFETDSTDMFKMNKLLAKHIIPLEPTKQPSSKKAKIDEESTTKSPESSPSVIISEALGIFFGIEGREMLQSEVIRRVWEYINANQLEDPANPMVILCDPKLQELLGCESIPALGIPEMLAHHHLHKRS